MAILIKGGMLMTMTEKTPFVGDVLIRDGMIAEVDTAIDAEAGTVSDVLRAAGCVVTPGLIDAGVQDSDEGQEYYQLSMLRSGVTTSCIWDDEGCRRWLVDADGFHELKEQMTEGTILIDPAEHEAIDSQITRCTSGIIITARRRSAERPWSMAVKLGEHGIPIAISTGYPVTKQKLLPVCAGLCVRDGMTRQDALAAITRDAASILGLTDRGEIRRGLRADLAIFDGDPLLLSTSLVCTIAGGRMIKGG